MNSDDKNQVLNIPIEEIIPNRFQPRLAFNDNTLSDLANSIKQHGIIQPLVLRRVSDKYEIIAGERRYKAAKMAGLASVPAIITDMDDNTSAEFAIQENTQRKPLTAIEEAKSYKALLDKGYMSEEDLAKKMGLSEIAIANKLRLLSLDEEVQQAVIDEKISERHARTLLKLDDTVEQKKMLKRIIDERLTVRRLDEEIKKITNGNDGKEDNMQDNDMFNTPEEMPNKFFNFLEDEAVNMNMGMPKPEPMNIPTEPVTPVTNVEPVEEIEMLDDFGPVSPVQPVTPVVSTPSVDIPGIISKVRDLHIESEKVNIEEMDLPNEYVITIKIKKD